MTLEQRIPYNLSWCILMEYSIIRTGGKQYRVSPGDIIDVEKLNVEEGSLVNLEEVLAISKDNSLTIGTPIIPGAKVVAEVKGQLKDKKITVFKFKRKTRYQVKRGHRRAFSRLLIREIMTANGASTTIGEKDGS